MGLEAAKPKLNVSHNHTTKTHVRLQSSRKLGCPAEIQIRSVNIFVDYYVDKDNCATRNSLTMAKKGVLKSLEKRLNDETNALVIQGLRCEALSRWKVRDILPFSFTFIANL